MDLRDKAIIVTGASKRLDFAIVKVLNIGVFG
jgi:NAD(P)-dependent dehydrogenase (short-subunit alcohol dehydrogenase family)